MCIHNYSLTPTKYIPKPGKAAKRPLPPICQHFQRGRTTAAPNLQPYAGHFGAAGT